MALTIPLAGSTAGVVADAEADGDVGAGVLAADGSPWVASAWPRRWGRDLGDRGEGSSVGPVMRPLDPDPRPGRAPAADRGDEDDEADDDRHDRQAVALLQSRCRDAAGADQVGWPSQASPRRRCSDGSGGRCVSLGRDAPGLGRGPLQIAKLGGRVGHRPARRVAQDLADQRYGDAPTAGSG